MANKIEVSKLSAEELKTELLAIEQRLASLRYENASTPLADNSEITRLRRQIARVNTELRARELKELEASGKLPARDRIIERRRRGQ